jgi:hypothetical protein
MTISAVEVYEKLKDKLGAEETKALLEYMERSLVSGLATKQDIVLLKEDLKLLEERLKGEVREAETRILRWLFGLAAGIATIILKDLLLK